MNFQSLVAQRYSVRSYTAEAVSEDDIQYLLACARLAPSAVNFQPWHFYVVRSEEAKEGLRACYDREWFRTAPLYIVCTVRRDLSWKRKSDGKDHGDIDVAIAAEHICLAATERGLGTCWVCNFDGARCQEVLQLPANEEAVVLLPVGHVAPKAEAKPKQRKEWEELVSWR